MAPFAGSRGGSGEEIAEDAETEERLVRGDVVGRRGRVPPYEQGVGNVDEPQGGCPEQ